MHQERLPESPWCIPNVSSVFCLACCAPILSLSKAAAPGTGVPAGRTLKHTSKVQLRQVAGRLSTPWVERLSYSLSRAIRHTHHLHSYFSYTYPLISSLFLHSRCQPVIHSLEGAGPEHQTLLSTHAGTTRLLPVLFQKQAQKVTYNRF